MLKQDFFLSTFFLVAFISGYIAFFSPHVLRPDTSPRHVGTEDTRRRVPKTKDWFGLFFSEKSHRRRRWTLRLECKIFFLIGNTDKIDPGTSRKVCAPTRRGARHAEEKGQSECVVWVWSKITFQAATSEPRHVGAQDMRRRKASVSV